ncbi:MBL fold metallo-hydrolase [Cloacibacillus porcorum]|uniref:MBL fold metallo-hydrolase n=1 Tax=Cloacibacillus porcorum TaxID=1197717 RepID=UPI0023F3A63D|nr:MBL fold metallo-hydrolase [Cloacibacillus porcorum]MDD7648642.1 MBL fold metallo-hydrolase [Cloacibacillus porcorum]MDY4094652.1 MBL fold metallo-hydrolase [Cloacibacillus porcorum]
MYELIQTGEKSWYIKNPANVGVYDLGGGEVCLIDAGNDKEAGRKILKKVTEAGWRVSCIINTHSNADHVGGNQFIQSRTGCRVLSTDIENAIARHPELESSLLYGGYPYAELRNKFLLAKPTESTEEIESALPPGLEIIKLPGHYLDMIGIMADDGTCFLADAIFSADIITKYHIIFIYDVAKFLATLEMLEGLEAKIFIPAHNEATTDIKELISVNRAKVHEIAALICDICAAPKSFERILKEVFDHYGLTMDHNQYVLVGSTIKSYLSWLHDSGRLNIEFIDNKMLWSRVKEC